MSFTIDMKTMKVNRLRRPFPQIRGIRNNGRHYQLPGSVLAEIRLSPHAIILYHPQTNAANGPYDVMIKLGNDVSFHKHREEEQIDLRKPDAVWPTGGHHLLEIAVALEKFMEQEDDYEPQIMDHILGLLSPRQVAA